MGQPWSNQVVNQIIIVGSAGQLLVYSPKEAAGDLVAAISGANATDQFNDSYFAGVGSYNGNAVTLLTAGQLLIQAAAGQIAGGYAANVVSAGAGQVQLTSGGSNLADTQADVLCLSANANFGTSGITLNAGEVTATSSMTVDGSLTVDNGASVTNGLTVDTLTVGGSSNTGGPNGTGFFNTQGLASGAYGSTHQHTLPNFPTATHNHPL